MGHRLAGALAAVILAASCQLPGAGPACNTAIDWVDFIEIGSTQYVANPDTQAELQPSDLGPVIAHVKFKVSGNVCDPNYRPKDGDAAFLDPGTPVYEVAGVDRSSAVAASHDGRVFRYVAMPAAP